MKLYTKIISKLFQCFISHVTTSETDRKLFQWNYFSRWTERVTKLFQNYFSDVERVGKYSSAAKILWNNNFEIILFHMYITTTLVRQCWRVKLESLQQQLRVSEDGRSLRLQTDLPHLVSLGAGRLSTTVTLLPLPPGFIRLQSLHCRSLADPQPEFGDHLVSAEVWGRAPSEVHGQSPWSGGQEAKQAEAESFFAFRRCNSQTS